MYQIINNLVLCLYKINFYAEGESFITPRERYVSIHTHMKGKSIDDNILMLVIIGIFFTFFIIFLAIEYIKAKKKERY